MTALTSRTKAPLNHATLGYEMVSIPNSVDDINPAMPAGTKNVLWTNVKCSGSWKKGIIHPIWLYRDAVCTVVRIGLKKQLVEIVVFSSMQNKVQTR
jgi:hypothetical protein